ncbi:hypothetical protein Nepgr_014542 [Nepenthes gracilis]|uniref:FHA domain-containing protein n=1 Tax=Nepenthes gracilis TaxID=150966 RepID=A0AAD3SM11_NEPGR|nr:hypothetical protein Nepgr_014542 [Nepenthes gracilis]
MEAVQSLSRARISSTPIVSPSSFFQPKISLVAANYGSGLPKQPKYVRIKAFNRGIFGIVYASEAESQPPVDDDDGRWLLEPVGDGDWRHIGYKVPKPGAYEIVSDVMTVGRLPEKASIVIPVATVSGLHARIQKQGGSLYITDMDSTNGTFIDDKRLRPGATANVSPGSCITFGDTHLAMFRVTKIGTAKVVKEEPEEEAVAEGAAETAI